MISIVILSLVLSANSHAGEQITNHVVKHADIADGRPSYIQKGFIKSYETQYGYSVSVGDTIAVHVPGGVAANTVAVGGGATNNGLGAGVSVATTVTNQYFQYVYNGTYGATVAKAILAGLGGTSDPTIYMAPASLQGAEIQVSKIKLAGTKRKPIIWMECALVSAKDKANFSGVITISDYDAAMRLGEIYNPNFVTREIAIAKIREAKELLELGIYTDKQFEEIKAKYVLYISTE
ncbi:MAG: hypothetical protein VX519_10610 [Myxococcota bacterium]|nr:hypothetical protein [Myxococcota bacterium]